MGGDMLIGRGHFIGFESKSRGVPLRFDDGTTVMSHPPGPSVDLLIDYSDAATGETCRVRANSAMDQEAMWAALRDGTHEVVVLLRPKSRPSV